MKTLLISLLLCTSLLVCSQHYPAVIDKILLKDQSLYNDWYTKLHASPELSTQESATSAFLKKQMKELGCEIIDSLGYYSFAAVMKNGKGPVVLYRTDMDALPVKEETELTYASKVTVLKNGEQKPVMHACGHDLHMTSWLGTARMLQQTKNYWSGTVIFLAQSAEETAQGAKAILRSANYQLLPTPDVQLALHDHATLETGHIGFCDGYSMAAVDMMNITIYGKGGHGAAPQNTIDPVVLTAQYITAIQTIVSRNLSSNDPAVITVGAINGGTIGNVIPDKVELKLTIRSYSESSRKIIFDRLKTIGDNLALAAGLDSSRFPYYDLLDMSIPPVYNDPALGLQLRNEISNKLGKELVETVKPVMIGEDFGVYGQTSKHIPSYLMWIGTVSPEKKAAAEQNKTELYSLHSSHFAPDYTTAIPSAIRVMTVLLINKMQAKK